MRRRLEKGKALALAHLWVRRGEARDLLFSLKPSDPRQADVEQISSITAILEKHLERRDLVAAVPVAEQLGRLIFNSNARVLAPLVKTGRSIRNTFAGGRALANERRRGEAQADWAVWQGKADEYWERHPNASKNEAALFVRAQLRLNVALKSISRRLKKRNRPA